MSEFKDIRWLHISDLHIGSPKNKWLDSTLQDKFVEKISNIGRLDFILVTGDVIHKGQSNNHNYYTSAHNLFKKLSDICEHIVFAIGNHDYIRDNSRFNLLRDWQKEEDKHKKEEEYLEKLASSFNGYVSFCKAVTCPENPISARSYVYDKYKDLNIVVLNTSIFSGQPVCDENWTIQLDDENNVKVNDFQKIWLCESDLPEYSLFNKSVPTIVIGHHSMEMLSKESQQKLRVFLNNIGAKHYFCGHIHKNTRGDSGAIKQWAAAGLFRDGYNVPSFTLYEMQKNSNTNVQENLYVYNSENGNWDSKEFIPDNDGDRTIENTKIVNPFSVEKSDISSGALRLPFGDGGAFNIYISKPNATDSISPHSHKNVDEVTYIIDGSVYACIDSKITVLNANEAVSMPKEILHTFMPKVLPCEFLTMGIETKIATYSGNWDEDIAKLNELRTQLFNNIDVLETGTGILNYLKSNIMEVRWLAIDILKQCLTNDTDENIESKRIVESQLQIFVSELLKSSDLQDNITAFNIAYEFSVTISSNRISEVLITDKHFLLPWVCMYYMLKIKPKKVNFRNLYIKRKNTTDFNDITDYECAFLAVLELLINKSKKLVEDFLQIDTSMILTKIPLADICIHFFVWYVCNAFHGGTPNYRKLSDRYTQNEIDDVENVIRTLLDIQNPQGMFKLLSEKYNMDKLILIVSEYMNCIDESKKNMLLQHTTKENIKQYLRIIVSQKCNLNCVYCHHEGRTTTLMGEQIQDNPDFDLHSLLEEAKKSHFKKIKISGGEPLLYPNILKICKNFENDFEDIGFTTNGTKICDLSDDFNKIGKSNLTFNVTLNTMDKLKYNKITNGDCLDAVLNGIDFLIKKGYKVKLNAVITSFNFDDIETLIAYAARMRINIKLLDLFTVGGQFDEFQRVSIAEIKNRLMTLYRISDEDFYQENDYLCANIMGIKVLIPQRVYCKDCQYNCSMYPCAEGLFGIRVYEDYTCARCFRGDIYKGTIESFSRNIEDIRHSLDTVCLSY